MATGRGGRRKGGGRWATMVSSAPVRPSVRPSVRRFVHPLVGLGWNPITSSGSGGRLRRRRRRRNRRGWR